MIDKIIKRITNLTPKFLIGYERNYPDTAKDRDITNQLIGVFMENMIILNRVYAVYQDAIELCRNYADGKLEDESWFNRLNLIYAQLLDSSGREISQKLLDACQNSPYSATELGALPGLVTTSGINKLDSLFFLVKFLCLNAPEERLYCKLMLDNYLEMAQEECLNFWYSSSEFFLPITDKAVLASFIGQVQALSNFRGITVDMPTSEEEARRLQDVHYQRLKELVDHQALLVGRMVQDLETQQEELESVLQQKLGLSQEDACKLVDEMLRAASRERLAAATVQK